METYEEFMRRRDAWLSVAERVSDAEAAHIHAWLAEELDKW